MVDHKVVQGVLKGPVSLMTIMMMIIMVIF